MKKSTARLVAAIHAAHGSAPFDLAVILGSGLGAVANEAVAPALFKYHDYDCFPHAAMVSGHAGTLMVGNFCGQRVLFFQGRFHLYQGFTAREAAFPVRLAYDLGCRRVLLTNAAGGINAEMAVGDLMFLSDHINLLGDNPLRGESGQVFIDLTRLYRQDLYHPLRDLLSPHGVTLRQGIYAALPGPSYETPAEIRVLRQLGADAVGMSTVPEAIMACYLGMETVAVSVISNLAAGVGKEQLCHADVLDRGQAAAENVSLLCRELIGILSADSQPKIPLPNI